MAKKQVVTGLQAAKIDSAVIDSLFDGIGDAKKEFRELLGSLDLTTEGGRKTYAALIDI
jgi:hypothetical protein